MSDDIIKLVTVGRGGWTAHYGSRSRLSGHPCDLDGAVADLRHLDLGYSGGCVLVNTTAIPDEVIPIFSMSGPMVGVDLDPGTVSTMRGRIVQWDAGGERVVGRGFATRLLTRGVTAEMLRPAAEALSANPEGSIFGNAGCLDKVSTDIYVAIARRCGAQVHTIPEAVALVDLRHTLGRLDSEEDPQVRADMVDDALELADLYPAALAAEARAAGLPVRAAPTGDDLAGRRLLARLDAHRESDPPELEF